VGVSSSEQRADIGAGHHWPLFAVLLGVTPEETAVAEDYYRSTTHTR
jgi:hypothetical protein